jgi:Tfp pilus assembly protein PilF
MDAESFYESNLAGLKKHHPETFALAATLSLSPKGGVEKSPKGSVTYFVESDGGNRCYLHQKNDPESEIPHFLKMVPVDATGVVIMLGMGLGLTPGAILNQRPDIRHLIVFELDPHVFRAAIEYRDLTPMLADSRLVLHVGPSPDIDKIMERFQKALQLETVYTLTHQPSFQLHPDSFAKLYDAVYAVVNSYNVGGATTLAFGDDNLVNRFANFPVMAHSHLLSRLKGKFKGVPAFLVAGGPSLNKNIHLLSLVKGRGVLFGVDTVLPALVAHGIYPDFIGAIDPQPITWEKIADCAHLVKDKKISLICSDSVTPQVPKRFPAEKVFWVFSGKKLSSWFNTLLGGSLLTAGAGTVAHLNLLSAVIMECSPIVFVGQDLAYSKGASHVDNTVLTNRERLEKMVRTRQDMTRVQGIDGTPVNTSRSFAYMKEFFERVVQDHPGIYINATEGGAHIKGTEVLPLKETLIRYCAGPCKSTVKKQISQLPDPDFTARAGSVAAEFEKAVKRINQLKKVILRSEGLIKECVKGIKKNRKSLFTSFNDLPSFLKKKLNQIDKCNADQEREQDIWQLLEELTMEGLRESERMKHKISALENRPDRYQEWLVKNLERMSYINAVRLKVLHKFHTPLASVYALLRKEGKLDFNSMERARLLFDDNNYAMAGSVLKNIAETGSESAEQLFLSGVIALVYGRYTKAEDCFARAEQLDPGMGKRVSKIQSDFAEQYIAYAERDEMDKKVVRHMLLKGWRCCKNNTRIKRKLEELARDDLKLFEKGMEQGDIEKMRPVIGVWYEAVTEDAGDLSFLTPGEMALVCFYYAKLVGKEEGKEDQVGNALERGLSFDKTNADIHAMQAELFFESQTFESGVASLNAAVSLDASHGRLWEVLGDKLFVQEQYTDALAAYEQLFNLTPERGDLLRKIGDCYLALDQPEAAREIYTQVKKILENSQQQP